MSKPVSKTAIGAFVVGAFIIVAALIVVMGTGNIFAPKYYCVSFFEGSVQGLSVGAPVRFRGVEVGVVTSISLTSSMVEQNGVMTRQLNIPVFYEIYKQQLAGGRTSDDDFEKTLEYMVRNGLRAQMQMQSIITGQQFIQLDFYPDANPVFAYKNMRHKPKGMEDAIEIPAVTSGLARLSKTITTLPIEDMLNRLDASLAGLQNILNSDSTKEMVEKLGPLANSLNNAAQTLEKELGPTLQAVTGAAQGLENNSKQLEVVFADIKRVLNSVDKSVNALSGEIKGTMDTLQNTSTEIGNFVAGETPLSHQLAATLQELRQLSFNLSILVETLEENPSALVWGQ